MATKSKTKRSTTKARTGAPKSKPIVLKAAPGYKFEKRRGGGVALMRRGVTTATVNCECLGGGSGCTVTINGPSAECTTSETCSGSCSWVVHVPGFVGRSRFVLF
jgi:hypothetical protein